MDTVTQIIPSKYKQTEIGMIPTDWDVKKLGDVAPLQRGFDLPTSQLKTGSFPVVYSNGISNFHNKAMAKAPGVVTGRSGTIGKVNYIEEDYWPHNTTLWVTNFKGNDEKYIYYLYSYLKIERFSTGSGVPTLNRNDVHEFEVAIPKLKSEQSAVATALSNSDSLITKLEKLIQKKKNIKQGVMQELLTGKRRLHGFNSEWQKVKLGELFSLSATYSKIKFLDEGGSFLIMDMGSVSSEGKMIALKRTSSPVDLLKTGDLVMPKDDIGGGNIIGKVAYIDRDNRYVLSDHVYKLIVKTPEINTLFFSYLINSNAVSTKLKKKVAGSAQLGLGKKSVEDQDVDYPKDRDEQIAIATVLYEMNIEIEKLESQLTKYQNIKQGMMQTLLTGKIRLLTK